MAAKVYIHSIFSTRVTNTPEKGFYDLCMEVGNAVLGTVSPLKIDSIYIASMDPSLFGVTGEIAASITSELGLLPKETLGIRGTSSAGGIGLIPAYKDIASGLYNYSLSISCEQMNPVKQRLPGKTGAKKKEAVQDMLRSVIDPIERKYGLSMILVGDMFEKALLRYLGMTRGDFLKIIPPITMEMYRRASVYPSAHFYKNRKTIEDYEKSVWVSPHYRRDDVVPPSTAACAVLLSSKPPDDPVNNRIVRLKGIGQGLTHPALTRRFGPITSSASVRRAIFELARRSSIPLDKLRSAHIGFPHDAFPSVSRMILKEIGFSHDESVAGLLSGRFNPCGGLVKCGHPVGCSGELQLVRAFQQLTYDETAIHESIQQRPADHAFTVSVGAALTNIVATYLVAHEKGQKPGKRKKGGLDRKAFKNYLNMSGEYGRYEKAMAAIPKGMGVVLTNTHSDLGWVNLLQRRDTKVMALSGEELDIGALVSVREGKDSINHVSKVKSDQVDHAMLASLGIIP